MNRLSHGELASLVKEAQSGDASAFAALYAATVESQLYFATTFLRDSIHAEDVIQEVYLSIYQSLHKIDNPKSFVAYLNRICYNTCVDFKKRLSKQKFELDQTALSLQPDTSLNSNPDDRYARLEENSSIHRALNSLSDVQRAAFLMRYYHNMKISEISAAMNLSESTVKRYIKAATAELKQKL